jgi:hypothetical protein
MGVIDESGILQLADDHTVPRKFRELPFLQRRGRTPESGQRLLKVLRERLSRWYRPQQILNPGEQLLFVRDRSACRIVHSSTPKMFYLKLYLGEAKMVMR